MNVCAMKVEFDNFCLNKTMFCYVVWMRDYKGAHGDKPRNWGMQAEQYKKFPKNNAPETFNFEDREDGLYYGHLRLSNPSGKKMNITNLGAAKGDTKVSGVTVIWLSADNPPGKPKLNAGDYHYLTRVIGWYQNAAVYQYDQKKDGRYYRVYAEANECHLIPENDRELHIPKKKFSPVVQYGKNVDLSHEKNLEFLRGLDKLLSGAPHQPRNDGMRRTQDAAKRKAIEEAAVNCVRDFYQSQNYTVESVESENRGWDLIVNNAGEELFVEVKGHSDDTIYCELTPNEYRAAKSEVSYRLAVVTDALGEKPVLRIFKRTADSAQMSWEQIFPAASCIQVENCEQISAVIKQI